MWYSDIDIEKQAGKDFWSTELWKPVSELTKDTVAGRVSIIKTITNGQKQDWFYIKVIPASQEASLMLSKELRSGYFWSDIAEQGQYTYIVNTSDKQLLVYFLNAVSKLQPDFSAVAKQIASVGKFNLSMDLSPNWHAVVDNRKFLNLNSNRMISQVEIHKFDYDALSKVSFIFERFTKIPRVDTITKFKQAHLDETQIGYRFNSVYDIYEFKAFLEELKNAIPELKPVTAAIYQKAYHMVQGFLPSSPVVQLSTAPLPMIPTTDQNTIENSASGSNSKIQSIVDPKNWTTL